MGEPATEMESMYSAKALRGLDLGLKKSMASDLDGLFRSQLDCCGPSGCKLVCSGMCVCQW